ncbi:MAG: HDIG domain-containing protein [Clostridia bacterium]|nr:HDIG domain-containing protein [Clostridia bacterium]
MERKRKRTDAFRTAMRPVVAGALVFAVFVLTSLVAMAILLPVRYDINTGDIATTTIRATRDISDDITAERLREEARNAVEPIYFVDEELILSLSSQVEAFFEALTNVRGQARSIVASTDGASLPVNAQEWQSALGTLNVQTLRESITPSLSQEQLLAVLSADEEELFALENIVKPKISTNLEYLSADRVDAVKSLCSRELEAAQLSQELKAIGNLLFEEFLQPTYLIDEDATEEARRQAALSVDTSSCVIERGAIIVSEGSRVTTSQYALLAALDLIEDGADDSAVVFGVSTFLFLAFAAYYIVMNACAPDVIRDAKRMLIVVASMAASILLYWASRELSVLLVPYVLTPVLCAVLVDTKTAYATTILTSLVFAVCSSGSAGVFSADSFIVTAVSIASGCAGVALLNGRGMSRTSMMVSGAVAAAVAILMSAMVGVAYESLLSDVLMDCLWVFIGVATSIVICIGTMPLWEQVFSLATEMRLNELSSLNHPLLKRLESEATGTYQHCLNVGAMAEAAAAAIGANAALARVGGYYHDVGKLTRPSYFIENQAPNSNIHDTLEPEKSAQYIAAHQSDGAALLTKYKLPKAVIKIAAEHHGNSLLVQFYRLAQERAASGETVPEKPFRYTGQRPSTVEGAIVTLADCCEAAVRALKQNDREAIEKRVRSVVYAGCSGPDTILSNCPLTMKQIAVIERSFVRTLSGMKHERIEYAQSSGTAGGDE